MTENNLYTERLEDVPNELFGSNLGVTLDRYHLLLSNLTTEQRLKRVDALELFNRIVLSLQEDLEETKET